MAKSISEEELLLRKRARRRLIGAIAVATVVAVFLPMVLDHDPKQINRDVTISIPEPGSGAFKSRIVPAVPAHPDPQATAPGNRPSAAPVSPTVVEVPKAPPPHDTEAAPSKAPVADPGRPPSKVAPTPAPAIPGAKAGQIAKAIEPTPAAKGGYVVQIAALSDIDKAREIQQKLTASGIKAYTEVVPTAKGNVTRVRAGPFATRDAAEKAREKLKDMGLGGNVMPR